LATRLAEAAVAMRVPIAVGAEGRLVAFRPGPALDLDPGVLPSDADPVPGEQATRPASRDRIESDADPARRVPTRPLLIGGALTSAALSIAGAAFVAWRLGRPGRAATPMARAARAVRDARLASAIGSTVATRSRSIARRLD